tara:strand:+ start:9727 stop:10776 length:1050 start_codon:yes stop_codon:yes gene_type:complete
MKNDLDILIQNKNYFIDLRSENEFKKGSIPGSVNMPILSNDEHEAVGIEYKKKGQESAINLGHTLVTASIKEKRVKAWLHFIKENPNTKIFCYRGGLRSQIALKWIKESGVRTSIVEGGYKRFRSFCLDIIQLKNKSAKKWVIIGGNTGSGKTDFILPYKSTIDLEGIANHRGSAFGKKISDQPTASNFENKLALKYFKNKSDFLILEDESRLIGKNILHENWYQKMQSSDLVILRVNLSERVNNIYREYIVEPLEKNINHELISSIMSKALFNIKKRLGGKRYSDIQKIMNKSFEDRNERLHRTWIKKILTYYYDPMYNYKIKKRSEYIKFSGSPKEVKTYLNTIGVT